jgi:hypothetical protein
MTVSEKNFLGSEGEAEDFLTEKIAFVAWVNDPGGLTGAMDEKIAIGL